MSWLEIAAVVTSFLAIWLTAKRRMLCWPINLIACALYFKLFLDVRLYSDMVLQALFGAGIVYGWIVWARGKADDGIVVVQRLAPYHAAIALIAGAAGALAIGWFTSHYTNAALPWIDATLTSFSLVAQYWAARRQLAGVDCHRRCVCRHVRVQGPDTHCWPVCRDDRAGGRGIQKLAGTPRASGRLNRAGLDETVLRSIRFAYTRVPAACSTTEALPPGPHSMILACCLPG
jgi:nicotinamide mononucleotide transporter